MMISSITSLLVVLVSSTLVLSVQGSSNKKTFVPCQYSSYCKCPSSAEICTFDMVIEELTLFTQYQKNDISQPLDTVSSQYCTIDDNGDYVTKDGGDCTCEHDNGCFGPILADGKINRTFISVNRGLPGPTIIVHEGQTVVINVENRYLSNISIHWHGMHQRKTNWMDGVDSVTQFGIYPGKKFRYIFNPYPTGTFWYHAHSESQRVDGFFGAFVILENSLDMASLGGDFIDVPEMHTMTLLDWNVEENDGEEIVTYGPDGSEVGTDPFASGLINGKGIHPQATVSQLSTFNVSSNQRYRFRVVGVQNYYAFRFSIDGHKLKLIAADGAFIEPVDVDYIIIHAGERYDFILETKPSPDQREFMIRADTLEVLVDDNSGSFFPNVSNPSHTYNLLLQHSAKGVLQYSTTGKLVELMTMQPYLVMKSDRDIGSSPISCDNPNSPCLAVNCPFERFPTSYNTECLHIHKLTALPSSSVQHELPMALPDQTIFLNFAFEGPKEDDSINGRSMKLPSYPPSLVLPQDQSKIPKCTNLDRSTQCDDFTTERNCRCPHIVNIEGDKTIRMVLSMARVKRIISAGQDPRKYFAHPVHLHGHYFRVVDIQFGEYDESGSGRLIKGASEPGCIGSRIACTTPQWNNKSTDIATGAKYADPGRSTVRDSYPLKDTILIPAGGYAVVYFKANNPGVWFLHCHIADHQVVGMTMALSEDAEKINVPPLGLYTAGNDFNWTLDEFNFIFDDDDNAGSAVLPSSLLMCCVLMLFILYTVILN